jgi:hypothetical protein
VEDASISGTSTYVGYLLDNIQAQFRYATDNPGTVSIVLSNWGANEMGHGSDNVAFLPDATTWIAQYESIIDYVHGRFPNARIYIMYPWRRSFDLQAAELHSRINTIIADRSTVAFAGPDEAIWLKGSDNGANNSCDGTHYSSPTCPSNVNGSTAGGAACAAAWQPVLNY